MRIYGNRAIKTLPGQATRPTLGKVREALFNIWQGRLTDALWLDLCAGNGTMGAEALCRGAKQAIAIEKHLAACQIIQENWQKVARPGQNYQILRGDVLSRLKTLAGQQFDLIYFDPPYESPLYEPVLTAIAQFDLLKPTGELAVEHDATLWQGHDFEPLTICRQKRYSKTSLTFFSHPL